MTITTLSIAGVDPSGGAGVFADVKTFSALGAYGMGIVTALTAQSTRGVTGFVATDPAFVKQQWTTLADDILPDAIKIGMLANAEVARALGEWEEHLGAHDLKRLTDALTRLREITDLAP